MSRGWPPGRLRRSRVHHHLAGTGSMVRRKLWAIRCGAGRGRAGTRTSHHLTTTNHNKASAEARQPNQPLPPLTSPPLPTSHAPTNQELVPLRPALALLSTSRELVRFPHTFPHALPSTSRELVRFSFTFPPAPALALAALSSSRERLSAHPFPPCSPSPSPLNE